MGCARLRPLSLLVYTFGREKEQVSNLKTRAVGAGPSGERGRSAQAPGVQLCAQESVPGPTRRPPPRGPRWSSPLWLKGVVSGLLLLTCPEAIVARKRQLGELAC